MPILTFHPSGKTVEVPSGTSLLHACRLAGVTLSTPCAEKGFCGKCRVRVLSDNVPADERQAACLPAHLLEANWRASCIVRMEEDVTLADPSEDGGKVVVLSDFVGREPVGKNRVWEREAVLAAPSADDQTDDWERLLGGLPGSVFLSGWQPMLPAILSRLPGVLRESGFACRALGIDRTILDVIPGTAETSLVTGLAVDIGTTTIAAALVDLRSGDVLAVASRANPQSQWGDDVVSRMECAAKGRETLLRMRDAVVRTLEALTDEACRMAGTTDSPLVTAVAANTVMNHLFLGVPPGGISVSPFIPVFKRGLMVTGADVGWRGERPPLIFIVPNISAYVGGDITAGILAHDLHNDEGVTLLLDVGTNGEIALSVRGVVYACSTAAGPAFEGARIGQGMRASRGAISGVSVGADGDLDVVVIDGGDAAGLCGTGLLDAIAALRETGIIDEYGGFIDDDELADAALSPALKTRVAGDGNARGVRLWPHFQDTAELETKASAQVRLTQKDVREFQLAKGAIAAGVRVLAQVAGVRMEEIDRVLLAGGFGSYLDPKAALATGLLPSGVRPGAIRPVGNSSLAGARLCLLSPEERRAADQLAGRVRYIELSGRADFQGAFAEEMIFP